MKILLVDDDPRSYRPLIEEFKDGNHDYTVMNSGETALEVVDSTFDLILIDHQLGSGITGEKLLVELVEIPELSDIVFVMLTANYNEELNERFRDFGGDKCYSKTDFFRKGLEQIVSECEGVRSVKIKVESRSQPLEASLENDTMKVNRKLVNAAFGDYESLNIDKDKEAKALSVLLLQEHVISKITGLGFKITKYNLLGTMHLLSLYKKNEIDSDFLGNFAFEKSNELFSKIEKRKGWIEFAKKHEIFNDKKRVLEDPYHRFRMAYGPHKNLRISEFTLIVMKLLNDRKGDFDDTIFLQKNERKGDFQTIIPFAINFSIITPEDRADILSQSFSTFTEYVKRPHTILVKYFQQ